MSIYDDDELDNLDVVRFETQVGTNKVRFRTPRPPGVEVTLEVTPRPRKWDERRGPGLSGAFLVFMGVGIAKAKLTLRYAPSTNDDRERLRAEHSDFLDMIGSQPPGSYEKRFVINHPTLMMMTPPFTQCVFLDDPATTHDKVTQADTVVFELSEYRPQAPTLSAITAPGGNSTEGQAKDELATLVANRATALENLANQAGFTSAPGGGGTP